MARHYYSQRNNSNRETLKLSHQEFLFYFEEIYMEFDYHLVFSDLYSEIDEKYTLFFMEKLNKNPLLPFDIRNKTYTTDDLYDLIEMLHYYINLPIESQSTTNVKVDRRSAIYRNSIYKENKQTEFRNAVNRLLTKYGDGYYLTVEGEIFNNVTDGLDILVSNKIETFPDDLNDEKNKNEVEIAKSLFLHHSSTETDKRNALLTLGRVLEEHRKEIKQMFLSKDESDLFETLNRYNIRHSDLSQKKDYPNEIYFDWIFYNILAAIDAFYKIRNNQQLKS